MDELEDSHTVVEIHQESETVSLVKLHAEDRGEMEQKELVRTGGERLRALMDNLMAG